jgi:hypothetical protein
MCLPDRHLLALLQPTVCAVLKGDGERIHRDVLVVRIAAGRGVRREIAC